MILAPCTSVWGGSEILLTPLTAETYEDVFYVPLNSGIPFYADSKWGIYTSSGRWIEAGAVRHGADGDLVGQSPEGMHGLDDAPQAPETGYVYGGLFNGHYGHFICSSLARLWCVGQEDLAGMKVVFHSQEPVRRMFELDFVRLCFEQLGISEQDVVVFDQSVRMERLVIPSPSFAEQYFVHPEFRECCHRIGDAFLDPTSFTEGAPAYLTKTGLKAGVGRIANESVIEAILRDRGAEIIHPERLSFPDQIRLFSHRRTLVGSSGSAFHTSIFAPPNGRIITLSGSSTINSNMVLIDKINENNVSHVYSTLGSQFASNVDSFQGSVTLENPEQVGEALADLMFST